MKPKLRKGVIITLVLLALGPVFLFTPSLVHRVLRASTPAAEIQAHEAEWARLAQLRSQGLNSDTPEAFHRYSAEAFRWFRVRGMIDRTCDDTSPQREWHELIIYFTRSNHTKRPPELTGAS